MAAGKGTRMKSKHPKVLQKLAGRALLQHVLDTAGQPIRGLYAVGNNAASAMGESYPGAGVTIGPAMTFGYIAANDIAERSGNQRA